MNQNFAFIALASVSLALTACKDSGTSPDNTAPILTYATPVTDTVGRPSSHVPILTGGSVDHYETLDELPDGLELDEESGEISGEPEEASPAAGYRVVGSGPGGRDTAVIHIGVVEGQVFVVLQITVPASLGHTWSRLIVTGASVNDQDALIRDTIAVGDSGLVASGVQGQEIRLHVPARLLWHWNFFVALRDVRDTVVASGYVTLTDLKNQEVRTAPVLLTALYKAMSLSFHLQDSVTIGLSKQRISFGRVTVTQSGRTLADTTATFAPGAYYGLVQLPYILAYGGDSLDISVHGTMVASQQAAVFRKTGLQIVPSILEQGEVLSLSYVGSGGNWEDLDAIIQPYRARSFEPLYPIPAKRAAQ